MAKITFGMATSHSPMLNVDLETWPAYTEKDAHLLEFLGERLYTEQGEEKTFDEMLALYGDDPDIQSEITPEKFQMRFNACQSALDRCSHELDNADVDLVVVFGNDHKDVFCNGLMPALAIYCADLMTNVMPTKIANLPPSTVLGAHAWYDREPTDYPGHRQAGLHLIKHLNANGFDVGYMDRLPEGEGMAHSFTHIQKRIMKKRLIPMVPIFINTFYPPNQPPPKRCYELGEAVRSAIEDLDCVERVGIMCSGGLSHFMVHEKTDRELLQAIADHDVEALTSIPMDRLLSGNSEARNWIAATAATKGMDFELIDYIPCYRTPAGTGCAMAFGKWS